MTTTLVLGGARSGKSAYAQKAAEAAAQNGAGDLIFIATAQALDDEMQTRVRLHQEARDGRWRTVEAPVDLPQALAALSADSIAVVDCLTLWISNLMLREDDIPHHVDALAAALKDNPSKIWLVSNEVGWGIVPDNALARRFRDECGRMHQQLAQAADTVTLIVAGLSHHLKTTP